MYDDLMIYEFIEAKKVKYGEEILNKIDLYCASHYEYPKIIYMTLEQYNWTQDSIIINDIIKLHNIEVRLK